MEYSENGDANVVLFSCRVVYFGRFWHTSRNAICRSASKYSTFPRDGVYTLRVYSTPFFCLLGRSFCDYAKISLFLHSTFNDGIS